MKDRADQRTLDLLASPAARRQAGYAQRQRQLGRRQRSYWLTDGEAAAVGELVARLRGAGERQAVSGGVGIT